MILLFLRAERNTFCVFKYDSVTCAILTQILILDNIRINLVILTNFSGYDPAFFNYVISNYYRKTIPNIFQN